MTMQESKSQPDYYIVYFKGSRIDYYIDRNHLSLDKNEWVIVQAEKGLDMGRVLSRISKRDFESHCQHKYPFEILRKSTPEEIEELNRLREQENEVINSCQELVDFRGLGMKLVDAEYQFDKNKLTIYFTAEQRVDFRELVKDLAAIFRTRIELRQIGVRDEVKRRGGLGVCGRIACCCLFLRYFRPMSTQMARLQNLAVNPAKISGLCERLMCCLEYENDFYQQASGQYPNPGDEIVLSDARKVRVESVDIFREKVILFDVERDEKLVLNFIDFKKLLPNRKDFLSKWLNKK